MLTDRFRDALAFAFEAHQGQVRKGTRVPYVAHLLRVAGTALAHGADEDVAIAALLHDSVEDTEVTVRDLEARFGPRVARIVDGCTDAYEQPKPAWRPRKEAYLEHLREADGDTLLVSASDKLDNARDILADLRAIGPEVWQRFSVTDPDVQLWYYRSLVDILTARLPGPLTDELARTVEEMDRLAR